MATSISASFTGLKTNLEITGLQNATVATRQKNVRKAVEKRLTVLNSFVTGSYKRHTMISPLKEADIDIFVVLDPSYYNANGYTAVLDKVRSALLETYTSTPKISRNGQAVTVTFTDFIVDVVPAFNRKGGGYLIPNTVEKRWISTDPTKHESFISNANAKHGGDLVPLIKMLKRWNRTTNKALGSFYLELLTEQILRNVKISSMSSGCCYVFDEGRSRVQYTVADPAGLSSAQVQGLAGAATKQEAVKRFETAYARAVRAEEFESRGNIQAAVGEWKKVFGDYFPAYG